METLYQRILGIEGIGDPNKPVPTAEEYKKSFYECAEQNDLVKKLVEGKENISDIVSEISKDYNSLKLHLPHSNLGEKFYKEYYERGLDKIFYPLDIETFERWKPESVSEINKDSSEIAFSYRGIFKFMSYIVNSYTVNSLTGVIFGAGFTVIPLCLRGYPWYVVLPMGVMGSLVSGIIGFLGNNTVSDGQNKTVWRLNHKASHLQKKLDEHILDKNEKVLK